MIVPERVVRETGAVHRRWRRSRDCIPTMTRSRHGRKEEDRERQVHHNRLRNLLRSLLSSAAAGLAGDHPNPPPRAAAMWMASRCDATGHETLQPLFFLLFFSFSRGPGERKRTGLDHGLLGS